MFSFFKKNKKTQLKADTKVWMSWQAKYQGFVKDIQTFVQEGKQLVIIAFFRRTIYEIEEILKNQQLTFQKIETLNTTPNTQKILIIQAELYNEFINQTRAPFSSEPDYFLISEHYPLYTPENQLLENLSQFSSSQAEAIFYFDLDAPLMKLFGVERIKNLLSQFGLQEHESIQHAMISKSIQRAQQKLEAKIQTEIKTESVQDWFIQNNLADTKDL